MRIHYLPENLRGLIFDLDATLYDSPAYVKSQWDLSLARLAEYLGRDNVDELTNELHGFRRAWAAAHAGKMLSMADTFVHFGVPVSQSAQWREELFHPEDFLTVQPDLREALQRLGEVFSMAVVTNNASKIGWKTLEALGVDDVFPVLVGLDQSGVSKPSLKPFKMAAKQMGCELDTLVSIGDRVDIDLLAPLEAGMGGIWVETPPEVLLLPDILLPLAAKNV